jgi:hypothetical protein
LRSVASRSSFKEAVSKLEIIVEELKALPPDRLDSAADYIHRLTAISHAERVAILERTAGSLTPDEGDELARIIVEGCDRIDEQYGWCPARDQHFSSVPGLTLIDW